MRIPRIFTQADLNESDTITLDAKAQKHLKDVLRMSVDNEVILFNGDGHDYAGNIQELSKKTARVQIKSKTKVDNESPLSIHLLQPLARSEKMDWCLQKATELGVNKITPFISTRVNTNIGADRLEKKISHWQSVIQSACEQSGRAIVPVIEAPKKFNDVISNLKTDAVKLIASPIETNTSIENTKTNAKECICAIGPEGGFTDEEIKCAQASSFLPLHIGPRILRLETAVISAMTLCQLRWGDFS